MSSCYDGSFLCQNLLYPDFDNIAAKELLNSPSAEEIINQSRYCTKIPINEENIIGNFNHNIYLKGLQGKTGLYHLWIDHENCTDHGTFTMLCVYVGKGFAKDRINSHIKRKWPNPSRYTQVP